jgi:hypothetical protein
MAQFNITRENLLRSKTITPGWYRVKIVKTENTPAKTDGSMNLNVEFVITQDGPFKDVPVSRTFNEKAGGFAVSFFEALMGRKIDEGGASFNTDNAVGRELMAFIKTDMYQNRPTNKVEDFRSIE